MTFVVLAGICGFWHGFRCAVGWRAALVEGFQLIDLQCHCEEAKPTKQSRGHCRHSRASGNPWGWFFAALATSHFLSWVISLPSRGASHFLLLVQNKVTKEKHTPRHRPFGVPCGARQSGPVPKLGPQKPWASDIGTGLPPLRLRSSAAPKGPKVKSQNVALHCLDLLLTLPLPLTLRPVGDAEKRSADGSCPGPMSEAHVWAEFRSRPIGASIAGQSRSDRHLWARLFFGYFLLARQKKVTRPPQEGETARSIERQCSCGDQLRNRACAQRTKAHQAFFNARAASSAK